MKKFVTSVLLAFSIFAVSPLVVSAADGTSAAAVATVNVNTATAKELQSLPGVGKVTAENIIAYRTANGNFKAVDDLKKVKGIGTKTLEKIRGLVTVE